MLAAAEKFTRLEIANLGKSYKDKVILTDVSITVKAGQITGLLGPNGAGKTTLMKSISGLARISSGRIMLDGVAITENKKVTRRRIGVIPQENNLEGELTVRQSLSCYARLFGVKDFADRLAKVGELIELSTVLDKPVRQLSGGFARRAMIARALLPEPDLLLLDEPSVGLDPDVRRQLWDLLRKIAQEGKGILITTHYMEEAAQLCDQIYFLQNGRLAWQGSAEKMVEENIDLEKIFLSLARGGS